MVSEYSAEVFTSEVIIVQLDAELAAKELSESLKIEHNEPNIAATICQEFRRRVPEFTRIAAISVFLLSIEERLCKYFGRWSQLNPLEAEELASGVCQKLFECLCGRWPHGNIGAWVFEIAQNAGAEYLRKQSRLHRRIGNRVFVETFEEQIDNSFGREALERLLIDLPNEVREVYERMQCGEDLTAIEAALQITPHDLGVMLQGIDRPSAGSSRRRKNSRKRRS